MFITTVYFLLPRRYCDTHTHNIISITLYDIYYSIVQYIITFSGLINLMIFIDYVFLWYVILIMGNYEFKLTVYDIIFNIIIMCLIRYIK